MHYKYLLTTTSILLSLGCFSQARVVINNDAYIVIDNNAKLVVENPATNAVTTIGTGGNIVTESEFDQVLWEIGTATGTYVMPFTSQTTFTKIPFTVNITGAGSGSGSVFFSTYPGPVWDNNTYRPTDVTHMYDYNTNSIDNSAHVIDRFWIIDATGYGTKPSATFQFTYRDSEYLQAGNTIVEADLGAQRFNSSTNHWGDYLPQGVTNTTANTTSNVPVVPADFFRSWTLSEVTNPLAAELTYLTSTCSDNTLLLSWQTASETNVDHFEVEHYQAGQFVVIGFVQATGSGSTAQNYTYQSTVNREGIFRLIEVDTDGNRSVRSSVSASCVASGDAVASYTSTNGLMLSFDGAGESVETLQLYDAAGKLIFHREVEIANGSNNMVIPDLFLSHGMYMVRLKNGLNMINEKVIAAE